MSHKTYSKKLKMLASDEERLMSFVKKEGSCWVWQGHLLRGYGSFYLNKRKFVAHRASYLIFKGEIPKELTLDHLCRNRSCVNPDHLEPVTIQENIRRGEGQATINARKTRCNNGHLLEGENVTIQDYIYNGKQRQRRNCVACDHVYKFNSGEMKNYWRSKVNFPDGPQEKE